MFVFYPSRSGIAKGREMYSVTVQWIGKCFREKIVFRRLISVSVNVHRDRKTFELNDTLKYRHIAESYSTGTWNYTLAAEVGLLTRNIVIEGADDADHVLDNQSFGGRLLIGSFDGMESTNRRVRVENVEFRHCGQEGWSDYFDPR